MKPPPGPALAVTPWITLLPTTSGALRRLNTERLVAGWLSSILWSQACSPVCASSAITCRSDVGAKTRPPPRPSPIFIDEPLAGL